MSQRVALAAAKGDKTLSELASEFVKLFRTGLMICFASIDALIVIGSEELFSSKERRNV